MMFSHRLPSARVLVRCAAVALLLLPSCAGPSVIQAPVQPATLAPVPGTPLSNVAPGPSSPPAPVAAPVDLPPWIAARLDNDAAVSLVGGDASSVDVLFGQFEHPDEAIVRFDLASGCASKVTGPWPVLSRVVRGRDGFGGTAKPYTADELLAQAHTPAFRAELASIRAIYGTRRNLGEDKLAFSLDGRSVMVTATDERVLASADAGEHWVYVAKGKHVDMLAVAPDGRFGVVRTCSAGTCGAPPSVAKYESALVSFADPARATPFGSATLHDVIFTGSGAVVTTKSDAFGKRAPSKICLETVDTTRPGAVTPVVCVASRYVGFWHMMSPSPRATLGVVATVSQGRGVRLAQLNLDDGRELWSAEVPGDWEQYQWSNVLPSDGGQVALARGKGASDPLAGQAAPSHTEVLRAGTAAQIFKATRPLGWLSDTDLALLDRSKQPDPQGCGLLRVVSVSRGSAK